MSGAPGVLFEDSFEIRKMEDKKFDRGMPPSSLSVFVGPTGSHLR
jgi:hypothetical protein